MRAVFLLIPVAATGIAFILFGAPVMAVIAGALGAWALCGAVMDVANHWRTAKSRALRLALSGRTLAHAGLGFIAIGAAADASRPADVNRVMAPGETIEIAGRTLTLRDVRRADGPNFLADRATLDVAGGGTIAPERRYYWAAGQHTREVGLGSSLAGDLYLSIGEARPRE